MWFHFYIYEPMCRGCELSKGVFLLEFVKYFRCLWKTKQIWLQWTVVCLLSTMLLWFYKTYFISVNIFLNAVFQIMVDHASIPSSLILNSFFQKMFNWIIHIFDKKVFLYNWKFWTLFILVLVIFLTFINLVQRNFKFFSILISSMIIVHVLHIQIILITIMLISEILILCETVLFEISLQLVTINMMKMHSTRFLRREVIKVLLYYF